MAVIAALFYMLQVEVHLRMREICQQICLTQKKIFYTQHSININYLILIIVKKYAKKKNCISCCIRYLESRDFEKTKCCDLIG